MSGILSSIVNGITGLFGGLNLSGLTSNIVTLALTVFAIALGAFAIYYLARRRKTLDSERTAAIIKGLHYAGVAKEVFAKTKPDARDHLLSGLRWLFGGAGISGAFYGISALQPPSNTGSGWRGALVGLIPMAIGLAYLLFAWLSARRHRTTTAAAGAGYYRVSARRHY